MPILAGIVKAFFHVVNTASYFLLSVFTNLDLWNGLSIPDAADYLLVFRWRNYNRYCDPLLAEIETFYRF